MLATIVLALLCLLVSPSVEIFVSPSGSDEGTGTRTKPFQTPARALQEVATLRRSRKKQPGPIIVRLGGGTYYLTSPLVLSDSVSGVEGSPTVIAPIGKEKVVISGGTPLLSMTRQANGYVAKLPASIHANQLFVGPSRYSRPRLPETGYYSVEAPSTKPDRESKGDDCLTFANQEVQADWHNLGDVEMLVFQNWAISRFPIAKVDPEHHLVTFKGSTQGASWALLHKGSRFLVENVKEALKRPGQFYFDKNSHEVTVIPASGDNFKKNPPVVPVLEKILMVEGTREHPVQGIRFEGISFRHSAWSMPETGRNFPQAEADLGGAVLVQNARNIQFEKCEISEAGGYGLEIADNSQHISFQDGRITNLGAGGVKIGVMAVSSDDKFLTQHVTIRNNIIAGGGRVHPAAVGVWIGQSPYNRIENNEIADFYYTGVSIGWTWGYGASNAHHNQIIGNHIYDIGQGVLSDMGGIYHLGIAPGTSLSGNRIHHVSSYDYGGWGLYTDEGSSEVTLQDNIVYRCSRQSFHQHYGKNNLVQRNILAFAGESQLARTRAEDHLSFTLQNNIVIWKTTPLLWGNWNGQVALNNNLYWRTDGQPITFNEASIKDWQAKGRDKDSLFVDPQFVNPDQDDFRLRPTSPALKLGFNPMDPKGKPWPLRWKKLPPAFPTKP